MNGSIILIAGCALAIAVAGCGDGGEHPGEDSTPNVEADSAPVPGTVADSSRARMVDTAGLDLGGRSVGRPNDTAFHGSGTPGSDTTGIHDTTGRGPAPRQ